MNRTKEQTTSRGQARGQHSGETETPLALFASGMKRYALAGTAQAKTLAKLAAAAGVGIVIGVFCYWYLGTSADRELLMEDYAHLRAFVSYESVRDYAVFFSDWFCHHAVWLFCVLPLALTVYPGCFCALLCAARGMTAGFSVCTVSGGFSLFTVYYAAAQGALCVFLLMACAKGVAYAGYRRALPRTGHRQFSLVWLCGDLSPMLCGILFAAAAQMTGMLLVSAVCCFFV